MPYEVTAPSVREHLSFSQLDLAASCGEAYRRRYVEGETSDRVNVPAVVGGAFHEAIVAFELMYEGDIGMNLVRWDSLPDALTRITKDMVRTTLNRESLDSEELIYFGKQDLAYFFREKVPQFAATYVAQREHEVTNLDFRWGLPDYFAGSANMSLEVACSLEVAGHPFVAHIDQVFCDSRKRTVIRDIKTGKPKPGHAMQLEQYRVALEREHGVVADYGQLLYLHREEPYVQVVKWQLDDTDVERLTGRLVRSVGDGLFLVNGPFTGACEWCDYRPDCAYGSVGVHGSS